MNTIKDKNGFTLLELMFAVFILIVGIIGVLAVYAYCYGLNETSRNTTQAVNDARAVLEAMREESTAGVSNVANSNWNSWAMSLSPTASGRTNNTPLTSLAQENISTDITGNDPLEIAVTVTWVERNIRQGQVRLITLMTKR